MRTFVRSCGGARARSHARHRPPGPSSRVCREKPTRTSRKSVETSVLPLNYRPVESGGVESNHQPLGYEPNVCKLLQWGAGQVARPASAAGLLGEDVSGRI